MAITRLFSGIFLLLLATGCATLDKAECRAADWRIIGLEDGAKGHPLSYIAKHREACAEHGVTPDLAQYRRGHDEGLQQFCTAENGFSQGRAGRGYENVCPPGLNGQFLAGYQTGFELHALSADIRRLQTDMRSMQTELEWLQQRQANVENVLISGTLAANAKQTLLDQFKQMQASITALEISIREHELEAARLQGEYEVLNAAHPY